jgi:hypothetical protein
VVYVDEAGIAEQGVRVRVTPQPSDHATATSVESNPDEAVANENLLAGVLAITVDVDPMTPSRATIALLRRCCPYKQHREQRDYRRSASHHYLSFSLPSFFAPVDVATVLPLVVVAFAA